MFNYACYAVFRLKRRCNRMDKYWYCSVAFKGIKTQYSYLCDREMELESYVKVPFGKNNTPKIGIVKFCGEYTTENAPYPVEETKHILQEATAEEYENQSDSTYFYDEEQVYFEYQLKEADFYIKQEFWSELYDWAVCIEDSPDERITKKVLESYELCARHNIPEAALILGEYYYNGEILKQDLDKAYEFYELAANAGNIDAICRLGDRFYYDRYDNVDYVQAYYYYSLGALLHDDPNCLYKLGDLYLKGNYVEKNENYAFILYMRALQCINDKDYLLLAKIQQRVGKCYLYGFGTCKNPEEANELLSLALISLYKIRERDQYVCEMIQLTKKLITEAQNKLY